MDNNKIITLEHEGKGAFGDKLHIAMVFEIEKETDKAAYGLLTLTNTLHTQDDDPYTESGKVWIPKSKLNDVAWISFNKHSELRPEKQKELT